jgi:DNA invertase Pin-like site-specific DNA recombinase
MVLLKSRSRVVDAKPTGKLIGYARVSTEDQELRLQIDALERAGCWNIYKEHKSATRGKRPELELAILDLRPGDVLVVWKLDRLGRNMRQLYAILDRIHEQGASFKSLTEGIDFTTPTGELMFGMLGHFAQFEAAMTAKRTAAGIKALQDRGYLYGAKPKLSDARAAQLVRLRKTGMTKAKLAHKFGISPASVSNYLKRAKAKPRRK